MALNPSIQITRPRTPQFCWVYIHKLRLACMQLIRAIECAHKYDRGTYLDRLITKLGRLRFLPVPGKSLCQIYTQFPRRIYEESFVLRLV
jgi:hypothetical protein